MKMDDLDKNKHLGWFNTEIGAMTIYHGHKENMSWVATALSIPGFIGLGIYMANNHYMGSECLKWALFGVTVLMAIVVMAFVIKQFILRNIAAKRGKAFRELIQYVLTSDPRIDKWDHQVSKETDEIYPKFVTDTMKNMEGAARSKITWVCSDLVCYLGIAFSAVFACYSLSQI